MYTIALGCRCGSGGAIFSPSSPVISPDGCKAALLQNMSRAGEEEVGVDSGKRATSKNIAFHVAFLPHAVTSQSCCLNIKTGCHAATKRKTKSSLKYICLFLKRGLAFGLGTCCRSIRCDLNISFHLHGDSACFSFQHTCVNSKLYYVESIKKHVTTLRNVGLNTIWLMLLRSGKNFHAKYSVGDYSF